MYQTRNWLLGDSTQAIQSPRAQKPNSFGLLPVLELYKMLRSIEEFESVAQSFLSEDETSLQHKKTQLEYVSFTEFLLKIAEENDKIRNAVKIKIKHFNNCSFCKNNSTFQEYLTCFRITLQEGRTLQQQLLAALNSAENRPCEKCQKNAYLTWTRSVKVKNVFFIEISNIKTNFITYDPLTIPNKSEAQEYHIISAIYNDPRSGMTATSNLADMQRADVLPVLLCYQRKSEVESKLKSNPQTIERLYGVTSKKQSLIHGGLFGLLLLPVFLKECYNAEVSNADNLLSRIPNAVLRSCMPFNECHLSNLIAYFLNKKDPSSSPKDTFDMLLSHVSEHSPIFSNYDASIIYVRIINESLRIDGTSTSAICFDKESSSKVLCKIPNLSPLTKAKILWYDQRQRTITPVFPDTGATITTSQCLKYSLRRHTLKSDNNIEHLRIIRFTSARPLLIMDFKDDPECNVVIERTINAEEFSSADGKYQIAALFTKTHSYVKIAHKWFAIGAEGSSVQEVQLPKESNSMKEIVYVLESEELQEDESFTFPDIANNSGFHRAAAMFALQVSNSCYGGKKEFLQARFSCLEMTRDLVYAIYSCLASVESYSRGLKNNISSLKPIAVIATLNSLKNHERAQNLSMEIFTAIERLKSRNFHAEKSLLLSEAFSAGFKFWFPDAHNQFSFIETQQFRCDLCFSTFTRSLKNEPILDIKFNQYLNFSISDLLKKKFSPSQTGEQCHVCREGKLQQFSFITHLPDVFIVKIKGITDDADQIYSKSIHFNEFASVGGQYRLFAVLEIDEEMQESFNSLIYSEQRWYNILYQKQSEKFELQVSQPKKGKVLFYGKINPEALDLKAISLPIHYFQEEGTISAALVALKHAIQSTPFIHSLHLSFRNVEAAQKLLMLIKPEKSEREFEELLQYFERLPHDSISTFLEALFREFNLSNSSLQTEHKSSFSEFPFSIETGSVLICSLCFQTKSNQDFFSHILNVSVPNHYGDRSTFITFNNLEYFSQEVYNRKGESCEDCFSEIRGKGIVKTCPENKFIDLETCLRFEHRITEVSAICERCKVRTIHYQQNFLKSIGSIFAINLRRSNAKTKVFFPCKLSMKAFLDKPQEFKLVAIIEKQSNSKHSVVLSVEESWVRVSGKSPEFARLEKPIFTRASILIFRDINASAHPQSTSNYMTLLGVSLLQQSQTIKIRAKQIMDEIKAAEKQGQMDVVQIPNKNFSIFELIHKKDVFRNKFRKSSFKIIMSKIITYRIDSKAQGTLSESIQELNKDVEQKGRYEPACIEMMDGEVMRTFMKNNEGWVDENMKKVDIDQLVIQKSATFIYKLVKDHMERLKVNEMGKISIYCALLYSERRSIPERVEDISFLLSERLNQYQKNQQLFAILAFWSKSLNIDIGIGPTSELQKMIYNLDREVSDGTRFCLQIKKWCCACNHETNTQKFANMLVVDLEKSSDAEEAPELTLKQCLKATFRMKKMKRKMCSKCHSEQEYFKEKTPSQLGSVLVIKLGKEYDPHKEVEFPEKLDFNKLGVDSAYFALTGIILGDDDQSNLSQYLTCQLKHGNRWAKLKGFLVEHEVKPNFRSKALCLIYSRTEERPFMYPIWSQPGRVVNELKRTILRPPFRGLRNEGNLCSLISVFSAFYYSKPMWDYLIDLVHEKKTPNELIEFMLGYQNNKIDAEKLDEVFKKLINVVVKDKKKLSPVVVLMHFSRNLFGNAFNLFGIRTNKVCKCGAKLNPQSNKQQVMKIMREPNATLDDLLRKNFSSKKLKCSACGIESLSKTTYSTSPILVIELQTSYEITPIEMRDEIDVILHPCFTQKYRFYAVVSRVEKAHVVAHVKVDHSWYEINDESVRPVDFATVTAKSELLFFEKIAQPPLQRLLLGIPNMNVNCIASSVLVCLRGLPEVEIKLNSDFQNENLDKPLRIVLDYRSSEEELKDALEAVDFKLSELSGSEIKSPDQFLDLILEKFPTAVKDLFTLSWQDCETCSKCNISNNKFQTHRSLPLAIPSMFSEVGNSIIFEDKEWFSKVPVLVENSEEILEKTAEKKEWVDLITCIKYALRRFEAAICTKCQTNGKKHIFFDYHFGPILAIQLDRTQQDRRSKNKFPVSFPPELDLGEVCEGGKKYRIIAIIIHDGEDVRGGHYAAMVWIENAWRKFDGRKVENVESFEGVEVDVTHLFYIENR